MFSDVETGFWLKKVRKITVVVCVLAPQGVIKDDFYWHIERYVLGIRLNVD